MTLPSEKGNLFYPGFTNAVQHLFDITVVCMSIGLEVDLFLCATLDALANPTL